MRVLFLLTICTILIKGKLVIKDAGMAVVSRDDIGMIFYVAVQNSNICRYHITVRMIKCVEDIAMCDRDCGLMRLIGGDMGYLKPKCSKNVTLIYPNMYLHNRRGHCIIAIRFEGDDNQQIIEKKANVSFNTIINKALPVPHHLRGYYKRNEVTLCTSIDLDPLKKCQPVDCQMKYLGTRSYFNHKWQRCQEVPKCIYDTEKKFPDVGYTPITNKCVDLEKCMAKSDIRPLENKFEEITKGANKFDGFLVTLNCNFGKMNETGVCDCMPGWQSEPFQIEPSLFPYHMCNIEMVGWYDSNRSVLTLVGFFIAISAVAIAMIVFMFSFMLYQLHKNVKPFEASRKPFKDDADTEAAKRTNYNQSCVCRSCKKLKPSIKQMDSEVSPTTKAKSSVDDRQEPKPKKKKTCGKCKRSDRKENDTPKVKESSSKSPGRKDRRNKCAKKKEDAPVWKLGTFGLMPVDFQPQFRLEPKRKESNSSVTSKRSTDSSKSLPQSTSSISIHFERKM